MKGHDSNLTVHYSIVVDDQLSSQVGNKILHSIIFFNQEILSFFLAVQCILSNHVLFAPLMFSVS